jgi:hypothetical protein
VLINVVASAVPFHCTTELELRFVPYTPMVLACVPIKNWVGETDVIAGVGVGVDTVSVAAAEVPPPGVALTAVTTSFPAAAWSATVSWKLTWVLLT